MPSLFMRRLTAGVLIAAAGASILATPPTSAQTPSPAVPATRPDPLDARADVPKLLHEPAFARYRRLGPDQPLDWREANDKVGRIGGWRTYAREAQQPEPAASATTAAPGPRP